MIKQTNTTTNTKEESKKQIDILVERRNELIKALQHTDIIRNQFNQTVYELTETIAQIATFKTLLKLADSPKDITSSGADKCLNMYLSFNRDLQTQRLNNINEIYSDAMDIKQEAFIIVWEYLHKPIELTLSDTVQTETLKNGTEKNYKLFDLACRSIREYVRSWSKSQDFKKLHYIIGITEDGKTITSTKRPPDNLNDITHEQYNTFFKKYHITPQEQDILKLLIKGENTENISKLTNKPLRTIQAQIKRIKEKFPIQCARLELVKRINSEKSIKAKMEKHPTDDIYIKLYKQAQERTEQAKKYYTDIFHKYNKKEV